MRRSGLSPAIFAGLLTLATAGAAIAEQNDMEKVETEGSQITAAGADQTKPAKSLETVPDDNLGVPSDSKGPNGRLVRQLMAARPNEDLIICVAGCFSGRDRVVYAQPMEKPLAVRVPLAKQSSVEQPVAMPPQAAIPPSVDPKSPAILNGSSDGTGGASKAEPSEAPANSDGSTN